GGLVGGGRGQEEQPLGVVELDEGKRLDPRHAQDQARRPFVFFRTAGQVAQRPAGGPEVHDEIFHLQQVVTERRDDAGIAPDRLENVLGHAFVGRRAERRSAQAEY
ncbi:hypothetical protein RZS08_66680, partial [Arthrospira platensis SPKY1]|nr:hypothetical protein [Arthrospira platensis SPKY1]